MYPKYKTKHNMQNYNNMAMNRIRLKKILFLIFFIGFMLYVLIDFEMKTNKMQLREHFNFMGHVKNGEAKNNIPGNYFVDTPGCQMPYFNVTDNTILQFMYKMNNFTCKKALTRVSLDNATLWLNMNESEILERYNVKDMGLVHCFYNEIKRKLDEEQNEYSTKIEIKLLPNTPIAIPPGIEFINVECARANGEMFYKDFHFFAVDKSKVHNITANDKMATTRDHTSTSHSFSAQRTPASSNNPQVSVMIIGLNSVSHLNFLRQMKQTYAYIREHLEHVEFWGYNKVGDNAYDNLIPTLTGRNVAELEKSCRSPFKNTSYDNCAFLWKRFKKAGYQTAYAEDVSRMSLFNFLRPGFKKQPTDYYMYPLVEEMEKHISYLKLSDMDLCKGGRRSVDVLLEMISRFIPLFRRQLFFSFFWTVTYTHDFWNMPQLLDADIFKLLVTFTHEGILNNTVLFLMSDHGIRSGSYRQTYQGMMEERQPLLIALYPQWIRQLYPEAIANLAQNSKSLTTPFDLHYTILDLMNLRNLEPERFAARAAKLQGAKTMPRGMSLFLPIPETRTCELAGITSHWCTCHLREELPTSDLNVRQAARYTVELINAKLEEHPQCEILYLSYISDAIVAAKYTNMLKEISVYNYGIDITVRVQTQPGLAEFEATVRISTFSTSLIGTISRINLYGSQSYCIDDYALKMFCHCKEKKDDSMKQL